MEPLHGLRLLLGRLRTVSSASALPLAGILAGMLLVAAALALAVVLALAGVLGQVLLVGRDHDTSKCGGAGGRFRVTGDRLGVETGGSAAKKAGESRGEDEVVYVVALHEEFLSSVRHRLYAWDMGYYLLRWPGGVHSDFECPYRAACLKLEEADGYIPSDFSKRASWSLRRSRPGAVLEQRESGDGQRQSSLENPPGKETWTRLFASISQGGHARQRASDGNMLQLPAAVFATQDIGSISVVR